MVLTTARARFICLAANREYNETAYLGLYLPQEEKMMF